MSTSQQRSAVLVAGVIAASIAGLSAAAASPALFDKPARQVSTPLPADSQNPGAKPRLSCFYYRHFVVKELDLGEKGAEQLSIIPVSDGQAAPECRRDNAAGEWVVPPGEWSGYFRGVKGDYVFFDGEDGWNGGVGFAIFSAAQGKKIFTDAAEKMQAVELTASGLALRYTRVFRASCSLAIDAAGCWREIRRDTGLRAASPPNCAAAYERERRRIPDLAQQVLSDPTVIDYKVAVSIDGEAQKISPLTGKAIACRPAE